MSTRANIVIKDRHDELWFYRHSDGYPSGTMPTLNKFLDLVKEGKLRDNVSQSSGWLIIIGAEEYKDNQIGEYSIFNRTEMSEADKQKWEGKIPTTPRDWKVGAYEPTTGMHGDIEFLYVVDLENKTITVTYPDGSSIDEDDK